MEDQMLGEDGSWIGGASEEAVRSCAREIGGDEN